MALLCLAALAGTAAHATPRLGSAAFQSVRTCSGLPDSVNCMGPANPDLSLKELYTPGGERVDVTSIIVVRPENGGGRIESRVRATGALALPVLRSGVWAGDNNRIGSSLLAYGGFTNTGPSALSFALDLLVDWTGTGAPLAQADIDGGRLPAGEYGGEGLGNARLLLMDAAFVPAFASALDILLFAPNRSCSDPGVIGVDGIRMVSGAAGPSDAGFTLNTGCDGAPLALLPGASYVLFTTIQTLANRFGVLDATNTVRVVLSESLPEEARAALISDVVTDRSIVPAPGGGALLMAGLGLLGALSRQRRAGSARAH
jgi:hypothetical protein